jgi:hypothetical protein
MSFRRSLFPITFLVAPLFAATLIAPVEAALTLPRVSPNTKVTQTIGLTDLTLTYSRPGVKGRVIWGDLVPYGKPWRTGANEATTFTTTDEITFGGKKLPAGTYALVTVPGTNEWQVALNSEKDLWGAFEYKTEKDVLQVRVKPASAEHQEWMALTFEDLKPDAANLVLRWEKLRVAVPITVNVNDKALANARAAIASLEPKDWRTPYQAAGFTLSNEVAMDEGRAWLDKSLATEKNYYNLNLLARWQAKTGKKSEAVQTAKQALAAAKTSKEKIDTAPTEKLIAEWTGTKP